MRSRMLMATVHTVLRLRSRSRLCSLHALQKESGGTAARDDHVRLVKAVWPVPSRQATDAYMSKRQVPM